MDILSWLKTNRYIIILAIFGLVFLFVYAWFGLGSENKFNSPDETVNYTFIEQFAKTGGLRINESLNDAAEHLITPRNATVVNGDIVPASFLGIILIYGLLAKIFSTSIILYLTPLISVISVIFFYLLLKEIFNRQVSFISSLLLFILPPWWYYSARGMFHNVLFLSLLIIGLYFLVRFIKNDSDKISKYLLVTSGFFIGLSLITRTSEIIWVLFLVFGILIYFKKIKWKSFILSAGMMGIVFIPILYFNNQLFDSPLSFGYSQTLLPANSNEVVQNSTFSKVINFLLPFGIDFKQIGIAVYQYLLIIFSWFGIMLLMGIIWFLKNMIFKKILNIFPELSKYLASISGRQRLYFIFYLIISIWLILYYGSFRFIEYFDQSEIILGSSYLRYWLPIFVFGLPLISMMIIKISKIFINKRVEKLVVILLVIGISIASVNKVLADPLHGLFQIKTTVSANISKTKLILDKTESNSIIISGFADKILFPYRKVIVSLPGDVNQRNNLVSKLLSATNLYYFHSTLDVKSDNVIKSMKESGFEFEQIYYFANDGEILYKLQ